MAVNQSVVDEQLKRIGVRPKLFWGKEFRYIHELLDSDETIRTVGNGRHDNHQWLIVATDRRLLCVWRGILWGARVLDTPYRNIAEVSYKTGIIFGWVELRTNGGDRIKLIDILKAQAELVYKTISEFVNNRSKMPDSPGVVVHNSNSIADQLGKLAELVDKGHMTKEEFAAAKKKVLA
jgi:hypothetical protein